MSKAESVQLNSLGCQVCETEYWHHFFSLLLISSECYSGEGWIKNKTEKKRRCLRTVIKFMSCQFCPDTYFMSRQSSGIKSTAPQLSDFTHKDLNKCLHFNIQQQRTAFIAPCWVYVLFESVNRLTSPHCRGSKMFPSVYENNIIFVKTGPQLNIHACFIDDLTTS